jgi:RNA polymerase sigma-70 factor (ECF subfamily)
MNRNLISDKDLVHLYVSGDESAIAILLTRHKSKIYTSIYLLVKDRYLAEDIFQDTFIKVINTLKTGKYNEEEKKRELLLLPIQKDSIFSTLLVFLKRVRKTNCYAISHTLN